MHADYHFGNLLFDRGGSVVAVLDWEIAEIGQPLIDLSCLAVAGMSGGAETVGPVPGPTIEAPQLAALYSADTTELEWYCAFSCYKYSAVYAYNLMLHRRGKRPDPTYEERTTTIKDFIGEAHQLLLGEHREAG